MIVLFVCFSLTICLAARNKLPSRPKYWYHWSLLLWSVWSLFDFANIRIKIPWASVQYLGEKGIFLAYKVFPFKKRQSVRKYLFWLWGKLPFLLLCFYCSRNEEINDIGFPNILATCALNKPCIRCAYIHSRELTWFLFLELWCGVWYIYPTTTQWWVHAGNNIMERKLNPEGCQSILLLVELSSLIGILGINRNLYHEIK